MKKSKPPDRIPVDEALRLQRGIYASRNPTRQWLHQSRLEWLTAAIRRYFPTTVRGPALDVGTGSGILIPALVGRFQTVISLDIETAFLRHIKNRPAPAEGVRFVTGDIRALPIQNDSAQLVVCAEVLEHIDDSPACLAEINRVLEPGGLLMLSTPQPRSLLEFTAGLVLRRPMLPLARKIYREPVLPTGHINLISARRLSGKLGQNGFEIVETHKSGLYLPGLAEMPLQVTQKLAAAINDKISGTKFDFLLWTQFFVARKRSPSRTGTTPAAPPKPAG